MIQTTFTAETGTRITMSRRDNGLITIWLRIPNGKFTRHTTFNISDEDRKNLATTLLELP